MIKINKTIINNLAIVSLAEDFQAEDGKEFRQAIEQEIDKGYKSLIVDMTDLVYLDTPAIVSILSVRNYINEIGGEIRFVEPKDNRVKRLFTTTRLNQILDFYPDTQKAIEGSRKRERREVYKEDILHNFLIVRSPKGRAEAFIEEVKKIREYLSLKEIEEDAETKRRLIDEFFHILLDALTQSIENHLLGLADDIIDSLPVGILVINRDGEIKIWNKAIEDITEINRDRRLGRKIIEEPATPDVKFYHQLRTVLTTGEPFQSEDRFLSLGQEVVISSFCKAIRSEKGDISGAIAILQDITTKARFEKELERMVEERTKKLEKAQAQLVKAERLATTADLAARIAHEISNPLYGIKNALEIIAEDFPADSPKVGFLEASIKEIQRISHLLNNILDFSRPNQDPFAPTDINSVLEETLAFVKSEMEEKNILLGEDMSSDIPVIMASAAQLRQVFLNLIKNSQEAMPAGGQLNVNTRLISGEQDLIQIEFNDTGCGIPESNIEKIFDPFFTTKAENKGMGLGLAVTHDIILRHKGRIEVKNQEGSGTTFTIYLQG